MRSAVLVSCLAAAVLYSPPVLAQSPEEMLGGIAAGPTFIDIDLRPGEVWRGDFTVAAGRMVEPAVFDIEVADLAQDETGGKHVAELGTGSRSAAPWLGIPASITLASGEKRKVPLVLTCPPNAAGSYAAYVVVKLRPKEPEAAMAAVVVPTVGVELSARVRSAGPLHLEAERLDWVASGQDGHPAGILEVENTGIWRTEVQGDLLLYPALGGFPHRAPIAFRSDGKPVQVYPGQRVKLACPFDRRVPPGAYRAEARLDLGEGKESRRAFSIEVGWGGAAKAAEEMREIGTDLWLEEEIVELDLPAGAVRSVPVRLRNLGEGEIRLEAGVRSARMEEDGRWTFADGAEEDGSATFEVRPDTLLLRPKRSGAFHATVRLAREARLEAPIVRAVRITGRETGPGADGEWVRVYDTGLLLVLRPPTLGGAKPEIASLSLVRSRPDKNPGSAVLTLANAGGTTAYLKGTLALRRSDGRAYARMGIGGEEWEPVLAGGRRVFRMPLPLVDEGDFVVTAEIVSKEAGGAPLRAETGFTSTESVPEGLR